MLTSAGWMRASLSLLPGESLLEHVQRDAGGRFLAVVDAELPRSGDRVAAASLQRSAIAMIIPDDGDDVERGTPPGTPHGAGFLLDRGTLVGSIRLVGDTRLAGFLALHDGFFVVRGCTLKRGVGADPLPLPVVLLNAACLLGVIDS
jgi:hypothetical protein